MHLVKTEIESPTSSEKAVTKKMQAKKSGSLPRGWLLAEWVIEACTVTDETGDSLYVDNVVEGEALFLWIRNNKYPELTVSQYRTALKRLVEPPGPGYAARSEELPSILTNILRGVIVKLGKKPWACNVAMDNIRKSDSDENNNSTPGTDIADLSLDHSQVHPSQAASPGNTCPSPRQGLWERDPLLIPVQETQTDRLIDYRVSHYQHQNQRVLQPLHPQRQPVSSNNHARHEFQYHPVPPLEPVAQSIRSESSASASQPSETTGSNTLLEFLGPVLFEDESYLHGKQERMRYHSPSPVPYELTSASDNYKRKNSPVEYEESDNAKRQKPPSYVTSLSTAREAADIANDEQAQSVDGNSFNPFSWINQRMFPSKVLPNFVLSGNFVGHENEGILHNVIDTIYYNFRRAMGIPNRSGFSAEQLGELKLLENELRNEIRSENGMPFVATLGRNHFLYCNEDFVNTLGADRCVVNWNLASPRQILNILHALFYRALGYSTHGNFIFHGNPDGFSTIEMLHVDLQHYDQSSRVPIHMFFKYDPYFGCFIMYGIPKHKPPHLAMRHQSHQTSQSLLL